MVAHQGVELPAPVPVPAGDAVLDAAKALGRAARSNVTAWMEVLERIEQLGEHRAAGVGYGELVNQVQPPFVVSILAENQERLQVAGARLRRELARALAEEGMSQREIAKVFGVTRQRIATLLSSDDDADLSDPATGVASRTGHSGSAITAAVRATSPIEGIAARPVKPTPVASDDLSVIEPHGHARAHPS